jgi:xanthine dehydrogenase YagS FAD-binding subunit
MQAFTYSRTSTLSGAISAAASGATLIAGGTELVNWMKEAIVAPRQLVDINDVPGLDRIHLENGRLRIGALVRMSAAAAHADVLRQFPALAQALEKSASAQIRNMATMGGNLLQRTRCPYFRADIPLPCNKRLAGSGCSAIGGEDRSSAIFGGSEHCIATHPSDAAVALAALEAIVRVEGPNGVRSIPIADLYRLPDQTPELETTLEPGEVIVEIIVPGGDRQRRSHYLKIRERASYEFALVSAAVALDASADGVVRDVRLAAGGIAPKPWRLPGAEAALCGASLRDIAALRRAIATDFEDAQPGRHNAFKIELAQRAIVRTLQIAGALT